MKSKIFRFYTYGTKRPQKEMDEIKYYEYDKISVNKIVNLLSPGPTPTGYSKMKAVYLIGKKIFKTKKIPSNILSPE